MGFDYGWRLDHVKHSKLQRKYVNQMRTMGDVPWPARAYTYPPTFSVVGAARRTHVGSCKRPVGETRVRVKRWRRKQAAEILCGGRVFLQRGSLGRRRVFCEACRARKQQRRLELRIQRQIQSRFGHALRESPRASSRSTRMLAKFRRSGVR